jgi:hypothetical protein
MFGKNKVVDAAQAKVEDGFNRLSAARALGNQADADKAIRDIEAAHEEIEKEVRKNK